MVSDLLEFVGGIVNATRRRSQPAMVPETDVRLFPTAVDTDA